MKMKKLIIIAALAALLMQVVGCGSGDGGEATGTSGDTAALSGTATAAATKKDAESATETVEQTDAAKAAATAQPDADSAPATVSELFGMIDTSFIFASGVGGWSTVLNVHEDGSFDGEFRDSDMAITGQGFSKGSVYLCDFSGRFGEVEKVNGYTYSMKILDMEYDRAVGSEEIRDETKYIYSAAYGLEDADEILVYTPDAPVSELPDEVVYSVVLLRGDPGETLGAYGIYNAAGESAFVQKGN